MLTLHNIIILYKNYLIFKHIAYDFTIVIPIKYLLLIDYIIIRLIKYITLLQINLFIMLYNLYFKMVEQKIQI